MTHSSSSISKTLAYDRERKGPGCAPVLRYEGEDHLKRGPPQKEEEPGTVEEIHVKIHSRCRGHRRLHLWASCCKSWPLHTIPSLASVHARTLLVRSDVASRYPLKATKCNKHTQGLKISTTRPLHSGLVSLVSQTVHGSARASCRHVAAPGRDPTRPP